MTGADEIRGSIGGAAIIAFRPRGGAAMDESQSSRTGGKTDTAAAVGTGGAGRGAAGEDEGDDPNLLYAHIPRTDLGNAERMAGRFRDSLIYCPALGWLAWDGRRWCRDGAAEAVKRAEHLTARAIQDEAAALRDTPGADIELEPEGPRGKPAVWLSDKLRDWGRASEQSQRLASMSKRAMAMMSIAIEDLDRDPMRLNVLNGTLTISRDIVGGYVEIGPHSPTDYITRLAPIDYDPAATCEHYDRFIAEIQPVPEMRDFLHAWFGYSLTGDTGEQKMVFFYGTGRNGKGVLVNLMTHVAGGFSDSISIESFLDSARAKSGGQATPDIAALPGVRMLTTSEPQKGAKLDEALIKLFTGGDRIKARHNYGDFFSFVPQAKLTMQGNYKPKVRDTDEGMWSRLKLVPFQIYIPKERRDPKLFEKLKAESSGILNRMLDGVRRWLDEGRLVFPEDVEAATASYRAESDPLGRFLDACAAIEPDGRVQVTKLYDLFCAWAKANGEQVWNVRGFAGAMADRGFGKIKDSVLFWVGLTTTKQVHDFMDATGGADGYEPPGDLDE